MPKITIYVPDELKAEMDAAEGQQPNWSAVAQEAFRLECARLLTRKRSKGKMNETIERLRASKERVTNQEKAAGHAAGRAWAMERAEFDELRRAAEFYNAERGGEWNAPYDASGWFYAAIQDDERPEHRDVASFWQDEADTDEPSEEFVFAFAEGASEVLNEVEDKL